MARVVLPWLRAAGDWKQVVASSRLERGTALAGLGWARRGAEQRQQHELLRQQRPAASDGRVWRGENVGAGEVAGVYVNVARQNERGVWVVSSLDS